MAGAGIRIVSASAGSGKTYRLAQEILHAVREGVRPEGVVATTFTRKAAAELAGRVRRRLLGEGLADEAQRLSAARMGTVHAVCGGLVSEHAFELGLFPGVAVLDEDQAAFQFKRALSQAVDPARQQELARLEEAFSGFDWAGAVQGVVEKARGNRLSPDDLEACKQRSLEHCLQFLDPPARKGVQERGLGRALQGFLDQVDTDVDKTKGTRGAIAEVKAYLRRLHRDGWLPWRDWVKLTKLGATKKSDHLLEPVREAASAHLANPRLREDLASAITLVFDLAQAGYRRYQEHKRQWGALDYADQELLALELLERPEVAGRLSQELELLVVDEFQDTSPIQLAILLKLAAICGRAVWVGDQKQSIFAFRDTDPALMDACLERLEKGARVETLPKSWRSRPELVRLTSEVFARAFARQGVPEELVRLEPARDREPAGLGPVLERWRLEGGNFGLRNASLAAAVAALVADPKAKVRDKASGKARPVRLSDIGILCRTRERAKEVADALGQAGIRAELGRTELLSTPEARLALAGLRLWVDRRDRLARAEIARLVHHPDDPDGWLAALLAEDAFGDLPEAQAVGRAAEAEPLAGPVRALDLAMQATEAAERCLAWGESQGRLANLEALRAYALAYARQAGVEATGATPAGLVAHLEELAAGGLDQQGTDPAREAVTVSTWHGAKGLEWPVTVLYEITKRWEPAAHGVEVIADREGFDLDDPLAGRWVRYLPWPFGRHSVGVEFLTRIQDGRDWQERRRREARQDLRLLYVGWTRARDRLVFAGKPDELTQGAMSLMADQDGPLCAEPERDRVSWAEVAARCVVRSPEPAAGGGLAVEPGEGYHAPGPGEHPAARVSPSGLEGRGKVLEEVELGRRMKVIGAPEPVRLGEVLHVFLAADRALLSHARRVALAAGVLERWSLSGMLEPREMVAAGDALMSWLARRWPGAELHREWPVWQRLGTGSVLAGQADLVVMADSGFAVVDHKAFMGRLDLAGEHAAGYAGQLEAYAAAITAATGKPCLGRVIHMPVIGRAFVVGGDISVS